MTHVHLSKAAAALSPRLAAIAHDERRELKARIAAAKDAETMSVALAQPHRRNSDDPRLGEALGRFVAAHGLRRACYAAGCEYGKIVAENRRSLGFAGHGEPGDAPLALSAAELLARSDLVALKRQKADRALRECRGAASPAAMIDLVCDERDPPSAMSEGLKMGLLALAVHFGILKRGVNEGKPI